MFFAVDCLNTSQVNRSHQPLLSTAQVGATMSRVYCWARMCSIALRIEHTAAAGDNAPL